MNAVRKPAAQPQVRLLKSPVLRLTSLLAFSVIFGGASGCPTSQKLVQVDGGQLTKLDVPPPTISDLSKYSGQNYGVLDSNNQPRSFTWTGGANEKYLCQFGSPSQIASITPSICNSAAPMSGKFTLPTNTPNGQKTLVVTATSTDGKTVKSSATFYVHSELNGLSPCSERISETQAFEIASHELGVTALTPSFGNHTALDHPNKVIDLGSSELKVESLHRMLKLSSDKKMLLLTRVWPTQRATMDPNKCALSFTDGHHLSITRSIAPGGYEKHRFDCAALVLTADNKGVCIGASKEVLRRTTFAFTKNLPKMLSTETASGYAP